MPDLEIRFTAERLADGMIRLSGRSWSDTFPDSRLDAWVLFYRRMAQKYDHPSYHQTAEALEALQREESHA